MTYEYLTLDFNLDINAMVTNYIFRYQTLERFMLMSKYYLHFTEVNTST